MSVPGAVLFARFAYPPNELGYCGPAGAAAMLRADAPDEIARRARGFEGAWSYLQFIAAQAGLDDPLDERVVEAYWIGNDLLDAVVPEGLVEFLRPRFAGQAGGTWQDAAGRATAHHSFQVFEVYPWAAILRRTGSPVAVSVLDRCRIRTGVVRALDGDTATVTSRPLAWDGVALAPADPVDEVVRWAADGAALGPAPAVGDRVALHWDWVCGPVSEHQRAWIEALEDRARSVLGCEYSSPQDV